MPEVVFHNVDILIKNLTNLGQRGPEIMSGVLDRAMRLDIYPKWVEYISLTDHSLADLKKLGHPYSTRFGKDSFAHPDAWVHIQSGELLDSTDIVGPISIGGVIVTRLENNSEHYPALRFGTHKMRIRDPGAAAMAAALPAIKERFKTELKHAIVQYFTK